METFDYVQFDMDPREYALTLAAEQYISQTDLLIAALKFMSTDDVKAMLRASEWSPDLLEVAE